MDRSNEGTIYRGVIRVAGMKPGTSVLSYLRPYTKPGPAKASVTVARKQYGRMFFDGWVEVSKEWEVLD